MTYKVERSASYYNQEGNLTNYTYYTNYSEKSSQHLITEDYIDTKHTGITQALTDWSHNTTLSEWSHNATQSQVPNILDNFTTTSPGYNSANTTGYNTTFLLDNGAQDYSEGITNNAPNVLSDLSTQFDLGALSDLTNLSTEFPGYISPTNISFDLDLPVELEHMLTSNLTSQCGGQNDTLSSLCYPMGTAVNTTANASLGEGLELAPDPRWWALFLILLP